jgi:peptidyl-prolyl cis-trans isomerase SurA
MRLAGAALLAAGMTMASIAGAPTGHTQQRAESIAVIVNDEAISTFDVRQRALLMLIGRGAPASPEVQDIIRNQALRDLVDERLKLQEATARGVEISDADIDRRVAAIAQQFGVQPDQLRRQFAAVGLSINTLRDQIRADIAWRRLSGGRFGRRVAVTDRQVDQEMDRLRARITRPAVRVSEILLRAETPAEIEQARNAARTVLAQISAPEDPRQRFAAFSEAARQVSAAPTSAIGGDRDWAVPSELPSSLQPVVEALLPGQISQPVEGPGGVYLLFLQARRDGVDPATLEQVNLREVSAPQARRAELDRLAPRLNGCTTLDAQVAGLDGAEIEDLGDIRIAELSAGVRDRLAPVQIGRASAVYTKQDRFAVMVVCARSMGAEGLPSRAEIRDQLFERNLEIQADRYLRDLRREAYIR